MPEIQYPNNSNSDTAFVVQEGGQKNRVLMTVQDNNGTVEYSDSPNSTNAYVTIDGKKHRAVLTAPQDTSTLEMSNNPNSTKGYVTVDGKKHRVVLTANIAGGGGSAPVIDELNVTPSTSAQTITAPEGTDGYSPVNVSAVTSAIDANITAENIKKDVEILGVTGSYEGQTPTGTMYIISNGTYNVADKAIANVQVPTTAPAHYIEKAVVNGQLRNSTNIINLNGVTDLSSYVLHGQYASVSFPANTSIDLSSLTKISGSYACQYMFYNCSGVTSVDLSNLTIISGQYACAYMLSGCIGVTSVDLSSLTTISGQYAFYYLFQGCIGLTSVNLSNLTTISGNYACQYMFYYCNRITSVDLPSLTTISGNLSCMYMFSDCSELSTIKLNALNVITNPLSSGFSQMITNCPKLNSVEFGGLTASTFSSRKDQIAYLFNTQTGSQATGGCTVHFPSNFDPSDPNHTFDASTLAGYPTFGGNASYIHVAFDLAATE